MLELRRKDDQISLELEDLSLSRFLLHSFSWLINTEKKKKKKFVGVCWALVQITN